MATTPGVLELDDFQRHQMFGPATMDSHQSCRILTLECVQSGEDGLIAGDSGNSAQVG